MKKSFLLCALFLFFLVFSVFAWEIELFEPDYNFSKPRKHKNLNLVFTCLSSSGLTEFHRNVSSIIARLKATPPFDAFDGFRFFLLLLEPHEQEVIFKQSPHFPYIKVGNNFIQELKYIMRDDYKLVILDNQCNASAAEISSARETSLIILGRNSFGKKDRLAKVFLHEFGHSLGLRDENPSAFQPIIQGRPNCAPDKETAVKWWDDMVQKEGTAGYFEFQSNDTKFIKPTNRSIMNNPFQSYGYGPVNERHLRKELGIE